MHAQSQDFLAYAALYESGRMDMRSRALHEYWLQRCDCPILRLDSVACVESLVDQTMRWLDNHPYAGGSA